jgi:hypothetical protein
MSLMRGSVLAGNDNEEAPVFAMATGQTRSATSLLATSADVAGTAQFSENAHVAVRAACVLSVHDRITEE